MHYVIGDIHGCFHEFACLLETIENIDSEAQFILVGDIVDRGPDTIKMIRWAMDNIIPGGQFQMVIGNHEYEKISLIDEYFSWTINGDINCIDDDRMDEDYLFINILKENHIEDDEALMYKRLFQGLPYYIEIDTEINGEAVHYIIVHSDISSSYLDENEHISEEMIREHRLDVVWKRNTEGHPELKNSVVVHGHTPTIILDNIDEKQRGRIMHLPHDINVDCGLVYGTIMGFPKANLAAICLETMEEIYLY